MHPQHPHPQVDGQPGRRVRHHQPAADVQAGARLGALAVVPQSDLDAWPEQHPAGERVVPRALQPVHTALKTHHARWTGELPRPWGMLAGAQAQLPFPTRAASGLDTIRRIVSSDFRGSRGTMRSTRHIPEVVMSEPQITHRPLATLTCPSRIRCQAATGSWTKSRQWETQRTLFSSARATMCPPTKVDGVWPFNDAWLRTSL